MLKQVHQFAKVIDGKLHTYVMELDTQVPHMEQFLLEVLQFIGQVKAQQAAAQAQQQSAPAQVENNNVVEDKKPPEVVD